MKRSEMLKKLNSILRLHKTAEVSAEELLNFLEAQGIRPPHTKVINCNCYDHDWEPEAECEHEWQGVRGSMGTGIVWCSKCGDRQ
jgi:hypothetical protein